MKLFKKATKEAVEQTVEVVKEEAAKAVGTVKEKLNNDIWPAVACLLGGLLLAVIIKRPSVTVKVVVKHEIPKG